jgi:ribonuclease T2
MSHAKNQRRRKVTLPSVVVAIIVIGVFIYQYFWGTGNGGYDSPEPATPRPAATWTPTPVAAEESPSVAAEGPVTEEAPVSDAAETPPAADDQASAPAGDFDFYVLSLSWSPDYCATSGGGDPQQCSIGKKLGFVLHGLWPQYDKGYPSDCSTQKLPQAVEAEFPGLYPSQKLYDHEWEKHGTCSGLTPEQYLALSKRIKESVAIPAPYRAPEKPLRVTTAQLRSDFVAANPGMDESSLAVYCSGSGRFLQEIYICFSKAGQPAPCSAEVRNQAARSCRNPDLLVRNVK